MEYSTEQAKSIFQLIKEVSIYAYPLLIGLIFPLFWVLCKKLLGIPSTPNTQTTTANVSRIRRFLNEMGSFLSLKGDSADKFVFYFSLILFLGGGIFLKIGEYNKEQLRQKTLGLKQYFIQRGYLFQYTDSLISQGRYTKRELNRIAYNYPNEFLESGQSFVCVDSSVQRRVYEFAFPLLQSYIKTEFTRKDVIYLDSLFQGDNIRNFKNYFSDDIKEAFLSKNINNSDYSLDIIDDRAVLVKSK